MADYEKKVKHLEESLGMRTADVQAMQNELKMVKEFRRKRGQMQKDLDDVRLLSSPLMLILDLFWGTIYFSKLLLVWNCPTITVPKI